MSAPHKKIRGFKNWLLKAPDDEQQDQPKGFPNIPSNDPRVPELARLIELIAGLITIITFFGGGTYWLLQLLFG